ncbi:hypothetical protein ALP72_03400 [Pseudomonas coronafaciens pv. coronafaciens]|nr:hypothetical protein ALP72_03400 [Pseudomonas coronafaciens pv. coronafaciens]RMV69822.1 hypothetical protein ALP06_01941 [Pseudomonas coronafaciens pv. atropurpurea]
MMNVIKLICIFLGFDCVIQGSTYAVVFRFLRLRFKNGDVREWYTTLSQILKGQIVLSKLLKL